MLLQSPVNGMFEAQAYNYEVLLINGLVMINGVCTPVVEQIHVIRND